MSQEEINNDKPKIIGKIYYFFNNIKNNIFKKKKIENEDDKINVTNQKDGITYIEIVINTLSI